MRDGMMSADDLVYVTGKRRFSKQVEWFRDQFGIEIVQRGDGSPVMSWSTFEALLAKSAGLISPPLKEERPALRPALRSARSGRGK